MPGISEYIKKLHLLPLTCVAGNAQQNGGKVPIPLNKVQIRNPMASVKKEKYLFEVWYGDTFP